MQLDDMVGRKTRSLVQIVDVLGDDGGNLAGPVQRGERAVAAPRLCGSKDRLHRKAPSPRLVACVPAGYKFIERYRAIARPQSAGRAKVGNPAFGRNAGAR